MFRNTTTREAYNENHSDHILRHELQVTSHQLSNKDNNLLIKEAYRKIWLSAISI